MQFVNRLFADYAKALRQGDSLELARVEAIAAEYDAFNGTRLLDELAGLNQPAAA